MIDVTVPAALSGERLDRVVAMVTSASRADAAVAVSNGGAAVDGVIVRSGKVRLHEGQRIVIDPDSLPRVELPTGDESVPIRVVYEDADLIVVDKDAGVVVHPAAGNPGGTLVNGLLARYPEIASVGDAARPGIVHRLDAGTSGLLVVARTPSAYDALVAALSARTVARTYRALVWGHPESPHGVVDAPIGRDLRDPLRMAVVVDGRPARTHYRTLATYTTPVAVADLECSLETGRTHQIRVHLAAIGHPVVGDTTYGGAREGLVAPRPMLHATALAFEHPRTGAPMSFTSPLPDDMDGVLRQLR
jgi:23S rRNA pseudouridine1911/1915/1917 synthase